MGVIFMCSHEFDAALCDSTIENAARSLSLVSHHCYSSLYIPAGSSILFHWLFAVSK